MKKPLVLHMTSDPALLSAVRVALSKICERAGYSMSEINKIVLAVDEACTNVIKHAYKGQKDLPIVVTAMVNGQNLEIEINDKGEKADVSKIKSRPLNEVRPGGLGVYLMKSVMDHVEFKYDENGNTLYMRKLLPKKG